MKSRILGTLLIHYWRVIMHTVSSSPILRAVLGSVAIGAFGLLVFNASAQAQKNSKAEIRAFVIGAPCEAGSSTRISSLNDSGRNNSG